MQHSNTIAVPHTLCEWCEKVIARLRPSFAQSLERDRLLFHYPDLDALLRGTLQQRCHMCSIFAGWMMQSQKASDINTALEKSGTARDKRHKVLASIMKNAPMGSTDSWQAFDVLLGYTRDDETLNVVSKASLNYFKKGWRKQDVPPEMLTSFTGSQESFDMVKRWLDICTREHPECRAGFERHAPTRLLDVGRDGTQDVKLVDGSRTGGAPYVALSYCWGLIPQLMLLPDNYSAFEHNIPFGSLSKVAQDAATVCRAMSVRYLWIDAMCIIQGPDGDFQQEALRMESVYANALFTITAAASKDTSQPFLVHRNPLAWVDCQLREEQHSERYRSYIEGNSYCESEWDVPGTFALDSRGWCFQEQFLSPRSIYYGTKGIHWECRRCVVCEHEDDMAQGHFDSGPDPSRKSKFTELLSLGADRTEPETSYRLRELWGDVVYRYTATQLTHQSDKLVALAGIASVFQDKFKMTASFGLWIELFLDEILWFHDVRVDGDVVRNDLAPSWAWASLQDAQIYGANTLHRGETGDEHHLVNAFSATVVSLPRITGFMPLKCSIGSEPGSSFRLRGYLARCVRRLAKLRSGNRFTNRLDPFDVKDSEARRDVVEYYPDTVNERANLFCFLVRREHRRPKDTSPAQSKNNDTMWDHGLVLTPVEGSQNRFRRTGTYIEVSDVTGSTKATTNKELSSMRAYLFSGALKEQEIEIV